MSWSAISIPPIPQTMLFLRTLYPRYKSIIDITLHRIHQSEIVCQMARRTILSLSALDSGLLFFLFAGFLSVFWQVLAFSGWLESTQVGFSCSFLLDARMGGVGPSLVR
jgi:hypothetical protein